MDSQLPEYELYAIRYAERCARRSDHFIGGDPHDGPMPMDYFVWAAIGRERSFVIDTGFTAEVAAARGRRHLRCPGGSNCGDVAVVDRLQKPALRGTALEPGAAPERYWQMRHVSVDIDAGHQSAAKTEAASHRIVMDLVLRRLGGVEGFDAVGAEGSSAHGSNSSLPAQACTAPDPPQSFPSYPVDSAEATHGKSSP